VPGSDVKEYGSRGRTSSKGTVQKLDNRKATNSRSTRVACAQDDVLHHASRAINLAGDLGMSHMAIAKNPKIQAEIEHLFEGLVRPGRSLPSHNPVCCGMAAIRTCNIIIIQPYLSRKARHTVIGAKVVALRRWRSGA
jgi:hypothetical protein